MQACDIIIVIIIIITIPTIPIIIIVIVITTITPDIQTITTIILILIIIIIAILITTIIITIIITIIVTNIKITNITIITMVIIITITTVVITIKTMVLTTITPSSLPPQLPTSSPSWYQLTFITKKFFLYQGFMSFRMDFLSCFSINVMKCLDKSNLSGQRIYFYLKLQGDILPYGNKNMASGWKGVAAEAGGWLVTLYLYSRSRKMNRCSDLIISFSYSLT